MDGVHGSFKTLFTIHDSYYPLDTRRTEDDPISLAGRAMDQGAMVSYIGFIHRVVTEPSPDLQLEFSGLLDLKSSS